MGDPVGIISRPLSNLAAGNRAQQQPNRRPQNELQASSAPDDVRLQKACQQMEALFLSHMLKEMRATVEKSGFISGGQAEEIFTSLLDVEISKKMAARGGIGLSSLLMQQLGGKGSRSGGGGTP